MMEQHFKLNIYKFASSVFGYSVLTGIINLQQILLSEPNFGLLWSSGHSGEVGDTAIGRSGKVTSSKLTDKS